MIGAMKKTNTVIMIASNHVIHSNVFLLPCVKTTGKTKHNENQKTSSHYQNLVNSKNMTSLFIPNHNYSAY